MIYKYKCPCFLPKIVRNSVHTHDIGEFKASVLQQSDNQTEIWLKSGSRDQWVSLHQTIRHPGLGSEQLWRWVQGSQCPADSRVKQMQVQIPGPVTSVWLRTSSLSVNSNDDIIALGCVGSTRVHGSTLLSTQEIFSKCSVQFSRSVVSNSLWPHEPQHARPPCPSPIPGVHPKPMSIEPVMPSNYLILCHPLLLLPSIFPSIRVFFKWVSSLHQVAKVLEFQFQHQSFQWTPRTDLL